jgi:L-ascorbate metabolism protein UlaG (beta-lactamase superfamily)
MRLLPALILAAALPLGPLQAQTGEVSLTYLANMGVLVERGDTRIVIDGLHHGGLREYAAVPPALLDALEQARAPFPALTLALTTHRHLDHFDAHSMAARLAADSGAVYLAAREAVDTLHARTTLRDPHPRVRAVLPPGQGETRFALGGVELAVLDLPHNPTPSRRVANVGFLLDLGGFRILHVGDADPDPARFDPHRLSQRAVDVAIVPFWFLTSADDAVRRSIGARLWVATHVPPADTAAVRREVRARIPGALVLTAPGERHRLR